jgi:hypothetical protein
MAWKTRRFFILAINVVRFIPLEERIGQSDTVSKQESAFAHALDNDEGNPMSQSVIASARIKAPNMSHTVELLYPESAHLRAAFAGWKPDCANCCGLKLRNRPKHGDECQSDQGKSRTLGSGSRTKPTITPAKIKK